MSALRGTNWDALITSAPLDRKAATVAQARGEATTVTLDNCFREQPPTRPYQDIPANNLTGMRFGRVRALGLGRSSSGDKRTPWVCQCDCGKYMRIRAAALRRNEAVGRVTQCEECDFIERNTRCPERVVLRAQKAESDRRGEMDALVHPHLRQLMSKAVADEINSVDVLASIQRFIQTERLRLKSDHTEPAP